MLLVEGFTRTRGENVKIAIVMSSGTKMNIAVSIGSGTWLNGGITDTDIYAIIRAADRPISHSQDPSTDDWRLVGLQVSKPKNEKYAKQNQVSGLKEFDMSKVNRCALFRETERSANINGFQKKSLTRGQLQVRGNSG